MTYLISWDIYGFFFSLKGLIINLIQLVNLIFIYIHYYYIYKINSIKILKFVFLFQFDRLPGKKLTKKSSPHPSMTQRSNSLVHFLTDLHAKYLLAPLVMTYPSFISLIKWWIKFFFISCLQSLLPTDPNYTNRKNQLKKLPEINLLSREWY